jgi:hypothetical protein
MRVQPVLQHALLEYRLCRDWRDWRPNWISFSTQPIACLHGNKVTAFLFCLPFCPRFPPVQASHGNALLVKFMAQDAEYFIAGRHGWGAECIGGERSEREWGAE